MAALTTHRNTLRMVTPIDAVKAYKVAAGAKIFAGSLVALNGGYAAPPGLTTGLVAVGRAKTTVDNTGGAAGAKTIEVDEGTFKWGAVAVAPVQADVGKVCFMADDQSVSMTGTTASKAGIVYQVDSDGVWVQTALGT